MVNLEVKYAGLNLSNPLIVSSSGLTGNVAGVVAAAESGAGAVVLKSIFEQQIWHNALNEAGEHTESVDTLSNYYLVEHLKIIEESKKKVNIPIIASLNCVGEDKWIEYAKAVEGAGADAIELNVMILAERSYYVNTPFETSYIKNYLGTSAPKATHLPSSEQVEAEILSIVHGVVESVKIPVIIKIAPYFTSLESFTEKLQKTGIKGIVFFNNMNPPDFDLETFEPITDVRVDHPELMYQTLRWVGILESKLNYDLSASGGVYNSETCLKMLLAGANSVQLCSVLYKNGLKEIKNILNDMSSWMESKGYNSIDELRGKLKEKMDMEVFRRTQYMKMYNMKE